MRSLGVWRALFLLANALAILVLWAYGALEVFLNPRFAAPLPWVAVLLLAMGLVELGSLARGGADGTVGILHVFWFLPLVVGLVVRPGNLSGAFVGSRGPTAAGRLIATASGPQEQTSEASSDDFLVSDGAVVQADSSARVSADAGTDSMPLASSVSVSSSIPSKAQAPPVPSAEAQGEDVARASAWCKHPQPPGAVCVDTLKERFWYGQMLALYTEPSRHRGRRLHLVGMATRDATVEPDGWHVGRMMVWCCAADASPLGLHPVGRIEGEPLEEGRWVAVEGILDTRKVRLPGLAEEREIPVLREATATPAPAPQMENVFPFDY